MMEDANAHDPAFWKKQVDLGWTGMLIPEAYGGVEGTLTDMIVVAEEMGRCVMPGPFSLLYRSRLQSCVSRSRAASSWDR